MSDNMQEPIDVHTIKWREDEASMEGTQALRYLVQTLHDAQTNPSLQPMVQASMCSNKINPPNKVDAPNQVVEPSCKGGRSPKDSHKEEHLSEVAPRRRCIPCSPNRASKRSRCPSQSVDYFLNEGRSERGRHLQKRRMSPSPLSNSPPSIETLESSSSTRSSYKARSSQSARDPIEHGRGQRNQKPSKRKAIILLSSLMMVHMDR